MSELRIPSWSPPRIRANALLVVGALGFATACDQPPPPPPPPAAQTSTAASPQTAPPGKAAAPAAQGKILTWKAPSTWKDETKPHPMRKAWYIIPPADGDTAETLLTVMQVGGDLDSNINRWEGQFSEKSGETNRRDEQFGGYQVTIVEISGTFAGGGMPGSPTTEAANTTMLAAIVGTSPQPHFFKMVGPTATVQSAKADFEKMISEIK